MIDDTAAIALVINVAVVTALVEALKRAIGWLLDGVRGDYWPLISVAVGIGLALIGTRLAWYEDASLGAAVLVGLTAGLAASGVYSGSRATPGLPGS